MNRRDNSPPHSRRFPDLLLDESMVAYCLNKMGVDDNTYYMLLLKCRYDQRLPYKIFDSLPEHLQREIYLMYRSAKTLWPWPTEDELPKEGIPLGRIEGAT